MHSNNITIIIPARFASTRLPGKPLLKVNDKSIIQLVWEKAIQSKYANKVIVATDNEEIYQTVKSFGGLVEKTSPYHQSGSDRIAEVVKNNPDIEIAVNVQGDEPLITPESIDRAVKCLIDDESADISTLIRKIDDKPEVNNPNLVKVVTDVRGNALYFSRSCIPYERENVGMDFYAHIGLYVYRRESLLNMTALVQADIEKTECLEQLRALYNGMKIKTAVVDYKPIGVDTQEDLEKLREMLVV